MKVNMYRISESNMFPYFNKALRECCRTIIIDRMKLYVLVDEEAKTAEA